MSSALAPGYLIAAPSLKDPNFARAVVLMAEHSETGAVGFIINRPVSLELGMLLTSVDEDLVDEAERTGCSHQRVMVGGPVRHNVAWVLYRAQEEEVLDEGSIRVGERLVVGASIDVLRAFVRGERPGPFYVLLGYSGWGEAQLEEEIASGAWLPLELAEELAFDVPREDCWEEAIRRLGLTPGGFFMTGGGAMA